MAMDNSSLKFFVAALPGSLESGGNIDFTLPQVKPYYEIGEKWLAFGLSAPKPALAFPPLAQTKMAPSRGPLVCRRVVFSLRGDGA
jgi:hypothetical protein